MPQSKNIVAAILQIVSAIVLLALIFTVDWVTGYDVNVGPLYFLFVAFCTWRSDVLGGTLATIGCAAAWYIADHLTGHPYAKAWILYENVIVRIFVHAIVVFSIVVYKKTLETHRERVRTLERLFQVCPCCGKIALPGGVWKSPDELAATRSEIYETCPTCAASETKNAS